MLASDWFGGYREILKREIERIPYFTVNRGGCVPLFRRYTKAVKTLLL